MEVQGGMMAAGTPAMRVETEQQDGFRMYSEGRIDKTDVSKAALMMTTTGTACHTLRIYTSQFKA